MRKLIFLFSMLLALSGTAQTIDNTILINVNKPSTGEYWRTTWGALKSDLGAGSGSVTSVALALPSIFSVTGSPVTTTGTLTGTLVSQTANQFFAAPDGSAGAPVFRLLTANDVPTLPASKVVGSAVTSPNNLITFTGSPTTGALNAFGIVANEANFSLNNIGGVLTATKGGTGLAAVGAAGTILNSNGTTNQYTAPTFTSVASANGWTGLVLNIAPASTSLSGLVTTSSQQFAGSKTFQGNLNSAQYFEAIGSVATPSANFRGGINAAPAVITASTTLDATNYNVSVGTLTSTITITLPQCNNILNAGSGRMIVITKTGSDAFGVIIDPESSQTFTDGQANKTLYGQNAVHCICVGTGASAGTWNIYQ